MKYVYILGGLLLVVAAAGYIALHTNERAEVPANAMRSAEVTPLAPDVSLQASASSSAAWSVLAEPTPVLDGGKVRTSEVGRAVITHDSEILTSLDSNSEVTLSLGEDGKSTKIELAAGATWSKVERALEQDEMYEVYTPTMVAAVRGTSFGVSLDPTKSLVVTEGLVRAQQRDPETGEPRAETEVLVQAGNTLEDTGERFIVRSTTEADRDDWYVENNPTDEPVGEMIQIEPPKLVIPPGGPVVDPVVCTTDVQQCSDGSFVSRVAPDCAFAACPVVEEPIACTEEAMICPDGSSVGRVGPDCEFAACPLVEEPEIVVLTVTDFDPEEFFYAEENRIIIRGTGLDQVEEIRFDNERVDFTFGNNGSIGVEVSELDETPTTYDVTLTTPDEILTIEDAVTVLEPLVEEPILRIDEVLSGVDESTEFVIVRGPGMDLVDRVQVNGDDVFEFGLFNSTELHIFDTSFQFVIDVTVFAGSQSDTFQP